MKGIGIASRAETLPPFLAMEVLERAQALERQGAHVIHLELGEPDFPTPACIQSAALEALRAGRTKYTHSLGIRELREAIAAHYARRYQVRVSPDQILVTAGTSPALWLVFSAILEGGDEVILTDPHYACYPNVIRFAGGRPVTVPVREREGFQLDPESVRTMIGARTKALLINSPANPTGAVLPAPALRALADLGCPIISDEIYHGLTYEGEEHSILEYTDQAVVLNGFSKAYAMTGWRLGYAIVPGWLIRPLQKMHQNFFISASDFVQRAAIAALTDAGAEVEKMRAIYNERRRFIVQALRRIGFIISQEPQGAFYVLADATGFTADSTRFAFEILDRAHVAATPGIDFGRGAEGHIRFSYANSLENIREAVRRIETYLGTRDQGMKGRKDEGSKG
ncbi:MAG: pyridoxal phosphate-dependent aminotransferase [candidate division NC10 bacterium]|nr:pyridoxal phosphate-dependent aminotransferase [candidate division NC10 bacterium]